MRVFVPVRVVFIMAGTLFILTQAATFFLKGGVRIDTTQRSIVRGTWCLCGVVSLLRINFTVDDGENHIFILPKSMKG